MEAKEGGDTTLAWQLESVDVAVQAVDAFAIEGALLVDDFGNRAW